MKDSGISTGCFNTICPDFVQTNSNALLRGKFSHVSTPGVPQYSITPIVIMDLKNYDKWWVFVQGKEVEYLPVKIFGDGGLVKAASIAMFGGDVYSPSMKSQQPHTTTQMGSGRFAYHHWGWAAFFSKPRLMGYSMSYDYPDPGHSEHTCGLLQRREFCTSQVL
ncbi:hypothetical protein FCM35_KLT08202 [Carex littledalei]|uniref:Neprosin PEP catalytic domain-containing protein n=1 Tax=Carex littledalei TaxID=544730 RepID=A0A833QRQ3_9POAL|nr:hypothetical protein FCM35_KLT08202 [Carex littledalei]